MSILGGILKPQYLLHPKQIARRLAWQLHIRPKGFRTVTLPWNLPLSINPRENISENIWLHGIYDLVLTETLWRITGRGDVAVDVGANIGFTSSIFCVRAGSSGKIYAFEAHPAICDLLRANVALWRSHQTCPEITITEIGVSDRDGEAVLHVPTWFDRNNGISAIVENAVGTGATLKIRVARLDSMFPDACVNVLKVDVEGHELKVFLGLGDLLRSKSVRDIVFEETKDYPAPTHSLLESCGYSIFRVASNFWGVRLEPPDGAIRTSYFAPNYVATSDSNRLQNAFQQGGWLSLAGEINDI